MVWISKADKGIKRVLTLWEKSSLFNVSKWSKESFKLLCCCSWWESLNIQVASLFGLLILDDFLQFFLLSHLLGDKSSAINSFSILFSLDLFMVTLLNCSGCSSESVLHVVLLIFTTETNQSIFVLLVIKDLLLNQNTLNFSILVKVSNELLFIPGFWEIFYINVGEWLLSSFLVCT